MQTLGKRRIIVLHIFITHNIKTESLRTCAVHKRVQYNYLKKTYFINSDFCRFLTNLETKRKKV